MKHAAHHKGLAVLCHDHDESCRNHATQFKRATRSPHQNRAQLLLCRSLGNSSLLHSVWKHESYLSLLIVIATGILPQRRDVALADAHAAATAWDTGARGGSGAH